MGRRDRPDHYSNRARREGYAARSVYKLAEIQQKHHVLRRGARILDIGAAPGSWTQFASEQAGPGGHVVAVDQKTMSQLEGMAGITQIVGDIFDPETIEALGELGPYSCVLSDAAPATTGNRTVDTSRSEALVEHIIHGTLSMLGPGGAFVAKLFQGGGERILRETLQASFDRVTISKPRASRAESFEVFLVATGYTAP